jgi:hypothetical protein
VRQRLAQVAVGVVQVGGTCSIKKGKTARHQQALAARAPAIHNHFVAPRAGGCWCGPGRGHLQHQQQH